ncbi:WD repeat-containing protein 89 isoform X2 [Euwallacea fornicatus]|uniref:WD repeat-containing protein 89 isoform X2 n=1 Tax=Euwallacea fornicatus TaxID=995702 RepID=UPI00338EB856
MNTMKEKTETNEKSFDPKDIIPEEAEEVEPTFPPCKHLHSRYLDDKYILDISATSGTHPFIAAALSDISTDVFTLTDNELVKISQLREHKQQIVNCKFSLSNQNLLYTTSNDGTVKLWDLRDPKSAAATFKDENSQPKSLNSFDVSPCDRLLAAGTELTAGDAFILFWDVRNVKLLGGYWQSHTDDISQVQFHPTDSNKLMSGSTDGLINVYDLSEQNEDDALQECLNTEAFVDSLLWFEEENKWRISCITTENVLQLWDLDGAKPYKSITRKQIAERIQKPYTSQEDTYIVKCHTISGFLLVLCSYWKNASESVPLRSLIISNDKVLPSWAFMGNKQRIRASHANEHTNLFITGGEKGQLDVWKLDLSQINLTPI